MPCATVHLLVARDTLRLWAASEQTPFVLNERNRSAFLHGSLAPDIGFIPGVDRFISELAHYHRPAELCRSLLEHANTDEDVAFVWGWVAHVVADVALHPMVGRAVGEAVHGDRSRRMNAIENLSAHVAIEVGLDIELLERHADVPPPPSSPYFDGSSTTFMADAFELVYGLPWEPRRLARDHRVAVIRTRRWPSALRLLKRFSPAWRVGPFALLVGLPLAPLRWLVPRKGALGGFLTPTAPPEWLVNSVERGAKRVARTVDELTRLGLGAMENRNLESGQIQGPEDPHPAAVDVRARLSAAKTRLGTVTRPSDDKDRTPVVPCAKARRGVAGAQKLDSLHVRHADRPQ